MASIFLSYSRSDASAAVALHKALTDRGHVVWRDQSDLPEASLFREEITAAIARSDIFLLAISAASLRSVECRKEFEQARDLPKRIIPLSIDGSTPADAPPDLADINWIVQDDRTLERIDAAIRTDLQYLQRHTRFLIGAREWERDQGAVLRGATLLEAKEWLAQAAGKEPAVSAQQRQLIDASLRAQTRRRIAATVMGMLVIAIAAALFFARQRGNEQERKSLANRLAGESKALWDAKNYDEAMLRAVAAYQAAPTSGAIRALLVAADREPWLSVILHGHQHDVAALAFDPRGGVLVSGGGDTDGIHLFDTKSWKAMATMGAQPSRISQLVFSAGGGLLLCGDWDSVIRRWDTRNRRSIGPPLVQHRGIVESLAISPDGRFAAAGYSAGAVLWDLAATPPTAVELPLSQSRRVNAVAFADDGATLLAVEGAQTLIRWSFSGGRLSNRRDAALGAGIVSLAAHGTTIVAGLNDGTLVWLRGAELEVAHRTAAHPGAIVLALSFAGDGERLASAASDGSVHVWSAGSDDPLVTFNAQGRLFALAFDPRSSQLALSGIDPAIHVLDTDVRQPLAEVVHRVRATVEDVTFDGDGKAVIATTLDDTRIRIDLASRQAQQLPDAAKGADVSIIAERAGTRAAGYTDGRVIVTRDNKPTPLGGVKLSYVLALVFSPDGKLLVAGDNNGLIAAWDTSSWKLSRSWKTNRAGAWLSFSPDGSTLASVDAGTPQITLIDPRQPGVTAFHGECKRVFSAAFTADGTLLATGCSDGSLELFDTATRASLGTMPDYGHSPDFVEALARHPRDDRFAAGTEQGRIMIWTLDRPVWLRRACRRANRDLTTPIAGWTGKPLEPCSALLLNAPSDEHKPDVQPDEDKTLRIPPNVAANSDAGVTPSFFALR
jgi:WD40 repeat protein